MKKMILLLVALLLLAGLVGMAAADMTVTLDDGILKWQKVDNEDTYYVKATDSLGHEAPSEMLPATVREFNLKTYIDAQVTADTIKNTGVYSLYLEAYNSVELNTLGQWYYEDFEYVSPVKPQYFPPEVVNKPLKDSLQYNASTGKLTWEEYSNLTHHYYYDVGGVSKTTTETEINIHSCIDDLVNNDEIPYAESFTVTLSAYKANNEKQDECSKTISYKPNIAPIVMTPENTSHNGVEASYPYTGAQIRPEITWVAVNSKELTKGTDYTVSYGPNVEIGDGTIVLDGKGKYAGTVTIGFKIRGKDPDPIDAAISAEGILSWTAYPGATSYSYSADGNSFLITEGLTVDLKAFIDDQIRTGIIAKVHTYQITLQAHNETETLQTWTGSFEYDSSVSISIATAVVTGIPESVAYTGAAITPVPVVRIGETQLTEGTDYSVSYRDNVAVGTAIVTITGTGAYEGTVEIPFTIVSGPNVRTDLSTSSVSGIPDTVIYTGEAITPVPVVRIGETRLTEGTDYTVSYRDNVAIGTATVTITGTGSYEGTVEIQFTIAPCSAVTCKELKYSLNNADRTATVTGPAQNGITKATIPATISANGTTYQVTAVAAKAFRDQGKLKTLTIGVNIRKIGKSAWDGCGKLKKITIKTKQLKSGSVGANAFRNIHKKAVFKCPKGMANQYKKLLMKKGAPKTCKFK